MMEKRIVYLDAIKGFAILLMVMAHIIAWNFSDWHFLVNLNESTPVHFKNAGVIWHFIYSFHMPLFFAVAGYLTCKDTICNFFNPLCKRTKRLFIPYITTGFLILLLRGYYGYWFLFSLYQLSLLGVLLNYIYSKVTCTKKCWTELSVLIIVSLLFICMCKIPYVNNGLTIFCEFSKCTEYAVPFVLGYYMRKNPILLEWCEKHFSIFVALFMLFLLINIISQILIFCDIYIK